jgi:hypothetical protein
MPVFLHNARFGWATNSSSTHSIVVLKSGEEAPADSGLRRQTYGWQRWTASTPRTKLAWLGQALRHQVDGVAGRFPGVTAQVVEKVLREVAGNDYPASFRLNPTGYVDHQSRLDIPLGKTAYDDQHPARTRLLQDVVRFLLDPRVVVLGGHDNDGGTHPFFSKGQAFTLWHLFKERCTVPALRYDTRDSYYSVFSRPDNGGQPVTARFRWALDPGPAIVRAEVPELVDVSIADYCVTGCAYCYRGSTPQGGWASVEQVRAVISALRGIGTTEIAIGGGEPLQHPEIWKILEDFWTREDGPYLHVTTRELGWLQVPAQRQLMLDRVTAFGFSVDTARQAKTVIDAFAAEGVASRVKLQVIAGVMSTSQVRETLDVAGEHDVGVLLLGYKETGRGSSVRTRHVLAPEILQHDTGASVGIDTVLAQQWAPWLAEHAWPGSYTLQEGAFSCFIDAVSGKLYRSSFEQEGRAFPIAWESKYGHVVQATPESVREAYLTMQQVYGVPAPAVTSS